MRHIVFFGIFLVCSFTGFAQTNQDAGNETFLVSVPKISLSSTTSRPLSVKLAKGLVVYNLYAKISGSRQYPAQGEGLYTFDGQGWMATPTEALPFSNKKELGPGLGNAVLFLDAGTFTPPSAEESIGQFFLIRNTHASSTLEVHQVVDFGKTESGVLKILPKEGGAMIYSDGKHWFRLH